MRLEDQVCSLDLAKKLKELGVKQESLFSWHEWTHPHRWEIRESWLCKDDDCIAAFTVAELGALITEHDILPPEWHGRMGWGFEGDKENFVYTDTEVDARAKMLIYLLEHKLITV